MSLLEIGPARASAETVSTIAVMAGAKPSRRMAPGRMELLLPRAYVWHQQAQEVLVRMSTTAEGPPRRGRLRRIQRIDASPSTSSEAAEVATVRRKCLGSYCSPLWVAL
jgi:hypothetical protein